MNMNGSKLTRLFLFLGPDDLGSIRPSDRSPVRRVEIDGKQLRPILDRTSFVKYAMSRTYFINQPERLPLNTAMLGVIVT